jgi:uncharacterized coiled-coil protein SlyX
MQTRMIQIEEKIAHLEHHLGELDGVVHGMHHRMDGLLRQINQLRETVEAAARENADDPDADGPDDQDLLDDLPPHW